MKKIYLLFAFVFCINVSFTQNLSFEMKWSKLYEGEEGYVQALTSTMKTTDNYVLMGSSNYIRHESDQLHAGTTLIKVDLDGNVVWENNYKNYYLTNYTFHISDMIELPNGDYIIAITTEIYKSPTDVVSLKRISPDGDTVWSISLEDIHDFQVSNYKMALLDDNHVLLNNVYGKTLKFDINNGNASLWTDLTLVKNRYGMSNITKWQNKFLIISSTSVTILNNLGEVESVNSFPNSNNLEDLDTNHDWEFFDYITGSRSIEKIISTKDGGILTVGIGLKSKWNSANQTLERAISNNHYHGVVKKFDANLNIEFSKGFTTEFSPVGYINWLRDVVELNDGNFVLVGEGHNWENGNANKEDIWMLEIDNQGSEIWSTFFGGTSNEGGNGVFIKGTYLTHLSDNEFIVTTTSQSNDGDVPENNNPENIWAFRVKIDKSSLGVISVKKEEFTFYPNPVHDYVYFGQNLKDLSIYNLSGQLVKTFDSTGNEINLTELSTGIYLMKAIDEKGKVHQFKVLKK